MAQTWCNLRRTCASLGNYLAQHGFLLGFLKIEYFIGLFAQVSKPFHLFISAR